MMRTFACIRSGAVLALTGVLAACGAKTAAPPADAGAHPDKAANVTVTADQRQRIHLDTARAVTFRPDVEATGTVAFNGDRSTQVLSPISGPATRVLVLPGAVVTRGQPLVYVSSPDFAQAVADYRKALAANRNAKRIAERDSALFKNDALARADLEQAQADAASAEADLDATVQGMRALGVDQAQIDGVRDGKLIADGQLLQAGSTPCVTIADLRTMWVMANVFAGDLKEVAVGQTVAIATDASAKPVQGTVDYVASIADPATNAVSVRILVPNGDQVLRRDMFVRVQIRSSHEHKGFLVPVSSVLRDDQNLPFVFVVAADGGYARRRIDLGARVGERYEATNGLKAGDQVVAEGALFLQFAESQ
jgi:cobalt-zinc-cadmium efflux system membrane fusion protein